MTMKQTEKQKITQKGVAELKKELKAKQSELTKYQLERSTKQMKNVRFGKALRLAIARIETLLTEQKLKGEKG